MKISKRQHKFLRIPLINNQFSTTLHVIYNGMNKDIPIKIDTGCCHSNIPYKYFIDFKTDADRINYKKHLILTEPISLSFGTESNRDNLPRLNNMTFDEKLKCKNIVVNERFYNCRLDTIYIGNLDLYTSYDLNGNALLGMEILKSWDIHISESVSGTDKGKVIMLACPLDRINQSYIDELIIKFNIGQAIVDSLMAKIDVQALEASCIRNKVNPPIDF